MTARRTIAISRTVLVVDDDQSIRRSLSRLLRIEGYDVRTFASVDEFFVGLRLLPGPACLVLDVRMPGLSGLELQERLVAANSALPIVFITGHGDVPMSVGAMKKGAVDFLLKPFADEELLQAVVRAIEKNILDQQHVTEIHSIQARLDTLTPREREVMELVVAGRLNKQIADSLGTVEKTVKVHRARVMEKMQVESLAELVRLAERTHSLPPQPASYCAARAP